MSGIEHAVYTIVSEGIIMGDISSFPIHTADITIVIPRTGIIVSQVLRELSTANTSQPVLDVVAIGKLVRAASVKLLGGYASEGVIRIVPFIILLARRISNQI